MENSGTPEVVAVLMSSMAQVGRVEELSMEADGDENETVFDSTVTPSRLISITALPAR